VGLRAPTAALLALCTASGILLAGCGGGGSSTSASSTEASTTTATTTAAATSCPEQEVASAADGLKVLDDQSARHYTLSVFSPVGGASYVVSFALGGAAETSDGKVSPPGDVGFQVRNPNESGQRVGSTGCSRPIVVRAFYVVPADARQALAGAPNTVALGKKQLVYVDYGFTNTSGDKTLAGGKSIVLPQTSAPAPVAASGAAATALAKTLSAAPATVLVSATTSRGGFALDGGVLCTVTWTKGASQLQVVAAWKGSGEGWDLSDRGNCTPIAAAVGATGVAKLTPKSGTS
jgi:hypothetical protein